VARIGHLAGRHAISYDHERDHNGLHLRDSRHRHDLVWLPHGLHRCHWTNRPNRNNRCGIFSTRSDWTYRYDRSCFDRNWSYRDNGCSRAYWPNRNNRCGIFSTRSDWDDRGPGAGWSYRHDWCRLDSHRAHRDDRGPGAGWSYRHDWCRLDSHRANRHNWRSGSSRSDRCYWC
jgi:hypothetical protein